MKKLINYLKFSGLAVTITVNPYQWSFLPIFKIDDDWDFFTYRFTFLFLTIRVWIDDGSW